jgi:hypothetical protein
MKKIDIFINWKYDCIPESLKKETVNSLTFLYPEVDHHGHPKTYSEIQSCADSLLRCLLDNSKNNSFSELKIFTTSEHFVRRVERRVAEGTQIDVTYYFIDGSSAKVLPDATFKA